MANERTDGSLLSNMRTVDRDLSLRIDPVCCKCGMVLFVPDVITDLTGEYEFTVHCKTAKCNRKTYRIAVLIKDGENEITTQ